jgi:putative ABC transport system substrate-binding protein
VRRREFITLVGGAAVAWPLAARAQQPSMPMIGFLHPGSPEANARYVVGFRKGLAETGYVEGRNVSIEYRWGHGEVTRLPELATDLVRRAASVIVTPGGVAAALAAKAATATIPIVFVIGVDPVQAGLVVSFNRPGGNVTGITSMNAGLAAKQLGLLHQLLPGGARFAVLVNSGNPQIRLTLAEVQASAAAMGHPLDIVTVTTNREITPAFKEAVQKRADAILISPDPLFTSRPVQLATLAARHAMPAIYALREFAEGGGLISYGSNFTDMFRQAGTYVARILKSEKPADLPILQATKFELVINLQTAEAFGLDVPPQLLALADEVIE